MKRYISNYQDISMKGSAAELVKKWEGLSYGYEREGNDYMVHIARNHSEHYKKESNGR